MQLQDLYTKLHALETQKQKIEHEIIQTKKLIEKLSPFTKSQKIALFKSLFIGREDVYATYWINKKLTDKHKEFLLGFKEGHPNWELLPFDNIKELPSVKWKELNLDRMDKASRQMAIEKLEQVLYP